MGGASSAKFRIGSLVNRNRKEKLSHHVAMVAHFLDDNKTKKSLKKLIRTVSYFIDLIQFVKCWRNFLKLHPKVKKKKKNFVLCSPTPEKRHMKLGSFLSQLCNDCYEIYKSAMHVQHCSFAITFSLVLVVFAVVVGLAL